MPNFCLLHLIIHLLQLPLQYHLLLVKHISLFDLLLVIVFTECLDKHLVVCLLATLEEKIEDLECVYDDVPLLLG